MSVFLRSRNMPGARARYLSALWWVAKWQWPQQWLREKTGNQTCCKLLLLWEGTSDLSHRPSLLPGKQPCEPSVPVPSCPPLSTPIPLLRKVRTGKRDSFLTSADTNPRNNFHIWCWIFTVRREDREEMFLSCSYERIRSSLSVSCRGCPRGFTQTARSINRTRGCWRGFLPEAMPMGASKISSSIIRALLLGKT